MGTRKKDEENQNQTQAQTQAQPPAQRLPLANAAPLPSPVPAVPSSSEERISADLMNLLMTSTEKDLRLPEPREVLKGNTEPSNAWWVGPATFRFSAQANRRLNQCATWLGMLDRQVARVHARFINNSKVILIKPAPADDLTATAVGKCAASSGCVINLFDLLGPARLTVETGWQERYLVHYVPKGSPLWPGLVIDLTQQKERRRVSDPSKDEEAGDAEATAKSKKERQTKKKGEKGMKKRDTAEQATKETPTAQSQAPTTPAPDAKLDDAASA